MQLYYWSMGRLLGVIETSLHYSDFFPFPPYSGSDSYWDELLLTFGYLSVGREKKNSLSLE